MTLLTIAIPTYNRHKACNRTLENLINQIITNKLENDVSIIVSDNCSTDSTYSMLQNFQNKYSNIITIYKQENNTGMGQNFNFVIEQTNSEYIQICSDDDIYDENMIPDTIKIIKEHKPQYIFLNSKWPQLNIDQLVVLQENFIGKFSDALKLVSTGASHISPTVVKTSLIKNTPYTHSEWIELQKLVRIKEDIPAYISKKPYIQGGVADGETHWLNIPSKSYKYFTNLLEFCLAEENNPIFENIKFHLIYQCLDAMHIERFYPNNQKFKKYKKRLTFCYYIIITLISLLIIQSAFFIKNIYF